MIHISDIMNMGELMDMMRQGYVRTQKHPQLPYVIYNYTAAAQYKNVWNDVTEQCRGLIVDSTTGQIIARPFRKFFNWGQPGTDIALDATVHVTDKADGSLGILYPTPGLTRSGYSIATRGSFTSEQAIHATKVFNERYANRWSPHPDYTFLFEIVYPGNRIVLDYGDRDDLFMLTAVNNISGWSIPRASFWSKWPGLSVTEFEYRTLQEALEAPPRVNAEGLVVHDIRSGKRVKIKQSDYVALHRALTNTSARVVWSYLAVNACRYLVVPGKRFAWDTKLGLDPKRGDEIFAVGENWLDKFISDMPDEFYGWLQEVIGRLTNEVKNLRHVLEVKMHSYAAQASVDGSFNRAKFYALLREHESRHHAGMIGSLYDRKDITAELWKRVYPDVEVPFKSISEDVA